MQITIYSINLTKLILFYYNDLYLSWWNSEHPPLNLRMVLWLLVFPSFPTSHTLEVLCWIDLVCRSWKMLRFVRLSRLATAMYERFVDHLPAACTIHNRIRSLPSRHVSGSWKWLTDGINQFEVANPTTEKHIPAPSDSENISSYCILKHGQWISPVLEWHYGVGTEVSK